MHNLNNPIPRHANVAKAHAIVGPLEKTKKKKKKIKSVIYLCKYTIISWHLFTSSAIQYSKYIE